MRTRYQRQVCRLLAQRVRESYPCPLCGKWGNHTFHHLDPATKFRDRRGSTSRSGISQVISSLGSVNALIREIEKCCLLCRSCHDSVELGFIEEWELEKLKPLQLDRVWVGKTLDQIKAELAQEGGYSTRIAFGD